MEPYYQEPAILIYQGDALEVMRQLPAASVNCCVTSPPYWGLRDYGTAQWVGGLQECDHKNQHSVQGATGQRADRTFTGAQNFYKNECRRCGAVRVDHQLGLEPTPSCGMQGFMRLRRDLTESQREYVVRRLLGAEPRDAQGSGTDVCTE